MLFSVYHRTCPSFMDNALDVLAETFPGGFELVASVECAEVGRVFELTNHIDSPWWENAGVVEVFKKSRSTSVGDVIVDETGKRYSVNGIGLAEF